MLEILYLLEEIIPNLSDVIGVIGTFLLMFGVINAFFGYKIFKFMLGVMGFLIGGWLGILVYVNNNGANYDPDTLTRYFFFWAIVGSILAETFYLLGTLIVVGFISGFAIFLMTGSEGVAIAFGIIFGVLTVFFQKYAIIISTALSGGKVAALGLWFIGLADGKNTNTSFAGWMITICGMLVQFWMLKKFHFLDDEASDKTGLGLVDWIVLSFWGIAEAWKKMPEWSERFKTYMQKDGKPWYAILLLTGICLVVGVTMKSFLAVLILLLILCGIIIIESRRCRRESVLEPGVFYRQSWEKLFDPLITNSYVWRAMPMVPVAFLCYLMSLAFDDAWVFVFFPLAIASYVVWYKYLGKEVNIENQIPNQDNQQVQNNLLTSNDNVIFCIYCGAKMNKKDLFCANCGQRKPQ
jgi:hypothetical protein